MAAKKSPVIPKYEDWQQLSIIATHVDWLIDDAEVKTLNTPFGKIKTKTHEGKSRFSARALPSLFTVLYNDDILKVLPEAGDLGASRDERLSKLRQLCKKLPAFLWLEKQSGFQAAKQTIAKLGMQYKIASYLKDTSDFTLMKAIALPAARYEDAQKFGHSPCYPSRDELRKLSASAKLILNALDTQQFSPHLDVSPWLYKALESFKAELGAKSPGWTKPHSDAGLNQSLFQSRIIENLLVKFDHCSPAVVQHISGMFGIAIDDTKVRAAVKGIKASRTKNPKNGHFFT